MLVQSLVHLPPPPCGLHFKEKLLKVEKKYSPVTLQSIAGGAALPRGGWRLCESIHGDGASRWDLGPPVQAQRLQTAACPKYLLLVTVVRDSGQYQ